MHHKKDSQQNNPENVRPSVQTIKHTARLIGVWLIQNSLTTLGMTWLSFAPLATRLRFGYVHCCSLSKESEVTALFKAWDFSLPTVQWSFPSIRNWNSRGDNSTTYQPELKIRRAASFGAHMRCFIRVSKEGEEGEVNPHFSTAMRHEKYQQEKIRANHFLWENTIPLLVASFPIIILL